MPLPAKAAPGDGLGHGDDWSGTSVVLLGTSGGPVPMLDRMMTSQVVVVDGAAYVIDCGSGVVRQLYRAGLTHRMIRNVFVTHFHADHVLDYLPLVLLGRPIQSCDYQYAAPVHVYGPPSAGQLPPGVPAPGVAPVNPANPVPGMVDLHNGVLDAFAYTVNTQYLASAMGPDIREYVIPHDIGLPETVRPHPIDSPAPDMAPFTVMEDDHVRVTATLVPHPWPFPAFAFRFDTDHGSVVFSGDTAASENLIHLARGADLLVHEVMDVQGMLATGRPERMVTFLHGCHTDVSEVGVVAERAGVGALALSHIVPLSLDSPNPPRVPSRRWRARIARDYGGPLFIGRDLMRLGVLGGPGQQTAPPARRHR
jgi:ribonuclease BN (tRNA processing enzyme)